MKRNSKSRKILIATGVTVLSLSFLGTAGATIAGFVRGEKSKQSAFGLGGERRVSIFFNPDVWNQGKDNLGNIVEASYYLYAWHQEGVSITNTAVLSPSTHVTPVVSGVQMDLYVFEYDTTKTNMLLFLRWNPEKELNAETEINEENGMWNKTKDLSYTSNVNYYCTDNWNGYALGVSWPAENEIIKTTVEGISTYSWRIS